MPLSGPALSVHLDGLRKTIRDFEQAGVEISDLKSAMRAVGDLVASTARPLTNPKSRKLAGSIRPSNTKNKAVVYAGGVRVPYAGPQHFGWRARNIRPKLYLYTALDKRRNDVIKRFDKEIDRITKG